MQSLQGAEFPGLQVGSACLHKDEPIKCLARLQRLRMERLVHADVRQWPPAPILLMQLQQVVTKYATRAPQLAHWLETALPEGLTVYQFPRAHHRRIRTVNVMERINQEIRRRTRVARLFPNEAACLRLVSALLMETHDEWITNKCYLEMQHLTRHQTDAHDDAIYRKKVA